MKSAVLQLGEVTFDPASRTLRRGDGQTVELRNKSKAVLEFLANQPNRTVPKSELLSEIWTDVIASDESLVQCIADIRRIIGTNARKVVETIPREGYRLNVDPTPPRTHWKPLAGGAVAFGAALIGLWFVWQREAVTTAPQTVPNTSAATSALPGTQSEAAYLEVLKGRLSANRFDLDESLTAERHFRQAIAIDPEYARAYAELGTLLAVRFENDWTVLYEADKEKALYYAQKAVDLEADLWLGHYALGRLHSVFENLDLAEAHLRTAMALQPDNEDARAYLGVVLNFRGKAAEATKVLEQAVATHPDPPYWYFFALGHALYNIGEYARAEDALNSCMQLSDSSPYCLRYLIAVYGMTERPTEAARAISAYMEIGFDTSITGILSLMTFHHADDRALLESGLRLAGLPE